MTESESAWCSVCGLPLSGSPSCGVCGGTAEPLGLSDADAASAAAYSRDLERTELSEADAAWTRGDYAKGVEALLVALSGASPMREDALESRNYKALSGGQAVFVRLGRETGELVIDAPSVRLPRTQYVPALRLLLELSGSERSAVRHSVRGEIVLSRYVGRVSALRPSELLRILEQTVASAFQSARLLSGALQARAISREEHAAFGVDALGRGVHVAEAVSSLGGAGSTRPPPRRPTPAVMPPSARPPADNAVPAVLMGGLSAGLSAPPLPPRSNAPSLRPKSHPPMPAAKAASVPPLATSQPPLATSQPPIATSQPVPLRSLRPPKPSGAPTRPAMEKAQVSEATPATTPSALASPGASAELDFDPLGDTFMTEDKPAAPGFTGPLAGLSELLHKAQTLGTVLSFADQPATMCLLIRATVYRAHSEFASLAPDAVACLLTETAEHTREIYITAPGKRRGAMAIPNASSAFELMAKIVSQQGRAEPPAEPASIVPITTAQDAKQHIARYVSELEQAPKDLELRHYLAIGALCELLSRTKLPAATQERLKGIVQHAQKQGAVQKSLDLMMTALTRMMA